MANSTFTAIAQIIAGKLNTIISRINEISDTKANLSGATFTGNIDIPNSTLSNNGLRYPLNDGQIGDGIVTDGDGNLFFKDLWSDASEKISNEIGQVFVDNFEGGDFGAKLQDAINNSDSGSIINAANVGFDQPNETYKYVISSPIIINKPCKILLPNTYILYNGTYNNTSNVFNIQSDNVLIQGSGRSSRGDLKLDTTTIVMNQQNGGYHFYSRGHNVISITDMDIIGVRTTWYDAVQGSATKPINGSGGIYIEKPNPGTTSAGNNVNQILLSNLYIEDTRAHAVYVDTPILSFFENVRVSGSGGHGFFINGGTSARFDNCYVSSAHKAGFCLSGHSYGAIYNGSSEYSGIGYWFRSCNNISAISVGSESTGNRAQFVPNMDITTTDQFGNTVTISDVGGDYEYNFWRGHGFAVTGGRNIKIDNCFVTNAGLPDSVNGQSTQTRSFLIRGNARSVQLWTPRSTVSSGNNYSGRFDIAIDDLGGVVPRDVYVFFNPIDDAVVQPSIPGKYITDQDRSAESTAILDQGVNTWIQFGNDVFSKMTHYNPLASTDYQETLNENLTTKRYVDNKVETLETNLLSPQTVSNYMSLTLLNDVLTADGIQTTFSTSNTVTKIIFVDINGVVQKESIDYNLSGNDIIFTTPPSNGTYVHVTYFGYGTNDNQLLATQIASAMNVETFNGDGFTNQFNTTNPVVKEMFVEINGIIQLPGINYTISSNTITFTSPLPNGDVATITYF